MRRFMAGLLMAAGITLADTSAVDTSLGSDLPGLVEAETARVSELEEEAATLTAEVDDLASACLHVMNLDRKTITDTFNNCIRNVGIRINSSGIIRQGVIVQIYLPGFQIDGYILQNTAEFLGARKNFGFFFLGNL